MTPPARYYSVSDLDRPGFWRRRFASATNQVEIYEEALRVLSHKAASAEQRRRETEANRAAAAESRKQLRAASVAELLTMTGATMELQRRRGLGISGPLEQYVADEVAWAENGKDFSRWAYEPEGSSRWPWVVLVRYRDAANAAAVRTTRILSVSPSAEVQARGRILRKAAAGAEREAQSLSEGEAKCESGRAIDAGDGCVVDAGLFRRSLQTTDLFRSKLWGDLRWFVDTCTDPLIGVASVDGERVPCVWLMPIYKGKLVGPLRIHKRRGAGT